MMTSLSESQNQLKQAQKQLEREVALNTALAELSAALLQNESPRDISSLILDFACRFTRSASGYVGYIDPSTHYLVCTLQNDAVWKQDAAAPYIVREWRGVEEWVLHHKTPLLTNTPADDPRLTEFGEHFVLPQNLLSVPVLLDHDVVGQITLVNGEESYSETDLTLVEQIARLYAVALQCHLAELGKHRQRALSDAIYDTLTVINHTRNLTEVFETLLAKLNTVLSCDVARVMLLQDSNTLRVAHCQSYTGQKLPNWANQRISLDACPYLLAAYQEQRSIVLSNTCDEPEWPCSPEDAWVHSVIISPICSMDRVLGFLNLSSSIPQTFSEEDVDYVQGFADQAAVAIQLENSRRTAPHGTDEASLRQVRAHMTQTARLSVAGKIAAGVAHQINNPLTTVIAQTHMLLKQLPPDDSAYEAVETIRRATYQAGTVVQRLMDFARPSSYVIVPVDLNRTILNAISLIRAQVEPHIARITVDLAPDLPVFQGSEEHLEDVWINLILNARDAIDGSKEGHIHVTTCLVSDPNTIKVMVKDNGTGIAQEHLSIIFDPLFTTKDYGTGLGLAVCHDIIFDHGGEIQVTSHQGEGTIFTVLLPV